MATPERDLQERCMEWLAYRGWLLYHTWNSMHSTRGFPDVFGINRMMILVVEFKIDRKLVTPEQHTWLERFQAMPHVVARVVRPTRHLAGGPCPQINEREFEHEFNQPWPPKLGAWTPPLWEDTHHA